jgi:hypothetical protein
MRFIISLSIVLIAFDATKIRRIKRPKSYLHFRENSLKSLQFISSAGIILIVLKSWKAVSWKVTLSNGTWSCVAALERSSQLTQFSLVFRIDGVQVTTYVTVAMLEYIHKGFCLFAMQISANMAKISLSFESHARCSIYCSVYSGFSEH